ncbi:MAG: ATP-binding protein [Clostridiales bacterium]|nr:ATP-binding protein [Clostridiales bacterium]
MNYVKRDITAKLVDYAKIFPVVYLTGPRQSGKSTLLKHVFPDYRYVNLEEKDIREYATEDPRGFLNGLGLSAVIDEAQYAPDLFSYIQSVVDERDEPGMFVLSGSQNFLMMKSISQSLAGRVGVLSLLPFSDTELAEAGKLHANTNEWLYSGHYPRQASWDINPADFYPNYIKTYVERDVRSEAGVQKIDKFNAFMHICAMNVGSPINLSAIGDAIGTDARTISSWLNILEESYIAFRLRPYLKNRAKRYSKTPKLYFFDTGLLCSLLGISAAADLQLMKNRGQIFENAIIVEHYKRTYNQGGFPGDNSFFWRDSSASEKEVDLIVEHASHVELYEIKASQTAKAKYADNLNFFERNAGGVKCAKTVIYDGPYNTALNGAEFINRRSFGGAAPE